MKKIQQPIRLYWGENYAKKPAIVEKAIQKALLLSAQYVHLYPGDIYTNTQVLLAQKYQVQPEQIILGNGVESLLPSITHAFAQKGDEIITLSPSFVVYEFASQAAGLSIKKIPVGLIGSLHAEDILKEITPHTKIIFMAFPNAWTGKYHLDVKGVEQILQQFSGVVVIDECYYGLGKKTVLPLLKKYPNLLILKSVSKTWGLAGLRFGWCIGNLPLIEKLTQQTTNIAKDPIAMPSYFVLHAILPYAKLLEDSFLQHKAEFSAKLKEIPGLTVYPTDATFIPVTTHVPTPQIVKKLEKKKILIKNTSHLDYFLLGIPPKEEWGYVLKSLAEILKKGGEKI